MAKARRFMSKSLSGSLVILPYKPRKEVKMTSEQKRILERNFSLNPRPSSSHKRRISQALGVTVPAITQWFQARRNALSKQSNKQTSSQPQGSSRATPEKSPRAQLANFSKEPLHAPGRTDPFLYCLDKMGPCSSTPSFAEHLRLPSLHNQTIPKFSTYFS
ncbi:hypothetical protein DSO57_1029162 [Entomophthora muscae]|uniref:Uncharacterized protein n=1 Tax=Entomophthora muscae TaxID=34485 RepID=A0ACC2RFZ2_9FUNG|nr:hypothetical protein DSO57_1029162 [Entomophthora muscae]